MQADGKLGRVDGATVGMPHEMAFLNTLCKKLLGHVPFPRLAAKWESLPESVAVNGVGPESPLYEPHGFGYYKEVKRLAEERRDLASRAEARAEAEADAREVGAAPE